MTNNKILDKPTLNISLALSGGGARGIFHLGFIEALQENGVQIKAISGSSSGSIIGAIIACGVKPRDALIIFKSNKFKKLFKFNWFLKSIFTINLDAKLLDKLFIYKDLSDTKIPFFSCVIDYDTHETIYFDKGDAKKLLYASCAFFPLFRPIKYKNRILIDGGLLNFIPIKPLVDFGYPILAINVIYDYESKKISFKTMIVKIYKFFISAKISKNIEKCTWYIVPKEISKYKIFSFDKLQEKFDLGYKYGQNWCNKNLHQSQIKNILPQENQITF